MEKSVVRLDKTDRVLLRMLQQDSRVPLQRIATKLRVPKSTVHYRIRRLERENLIQGYYAKLDASKLGYDYLAVVLVRAKYGPQYHKKVGVKLARVPGVWAVYYVLGDFDFIILIRALDRDDYMRKLEMVSSMDGIERTSTQIVARVVREDPKVDTGA
jgi:DNA-binding Lrp family transcriptional regulator